MDLADDYYINFLILSLSIYGLYKIIYLRITIAAPDKNAGFQIELGARI